MCQTTVLAALAAFQSQSWLSSFHRVGMQLWVLVWPRSTCGSCARIKTLQSPASTISFEMPTTKENPTEDCWCPCQKAPQGGWHFPDKQPSKTADSEVALADPTHQFPWYVVDVDNSYSNITTSQNCQLEFAMSQLYLIHHRMRHACWWNSEGNVYLVLSVNWQQNKKKWD